MKEQEHSPEELNELELSHSSDVEFRIMRAKTLSSMRKDLVTTRKDQSAMKNDRALIKNTLEGTHCRSGRAGIGSMTQKERRP